MTKKRKTRSLAHVFLPHASNGGHPHVVRTTAVLVVAAFASVLQITFLAYETAYFRSGENVAAVLPSAVALMTNDARTARDVPPLVISDVLTKAAQQKANDMVAKGYFAHKEPNGSMPWHWFTDNGYNYIYAGENLAVNFTDTSKLLDAWLASPKHRDNILKSQYQEIGIGMATGTYKGREAVFVVQFLGRQKSVAETNVVLRSQAEKQTPPTTDVADVAVLGESVTAESKQSWMQKIKLSPRTFTYQMLVALLTVFSAALAVILIPRWKAHPKAILNGFAVVAMLVFFLTLDANLWGPVEFPELEPVHISTME